MLPGNSKRINDSMNVYTFGEAKELNKRELEVRSLRPSRRKEAKFPVQSQGRSSVASRYSKVESDVDSIEARNAASAFPSVGENCIRVVCSPPLQTALIRRKFINVVSRRRLASAAREIEHESSRG